MDGQLMLPYPCRTFCPDGRSVPKGMTWCGRCGEIIFAYSLVINHDLGYCGCPVEYDPVSDLLRHGPGFRPGTPFTRRQLNTRWDRQFFPDCICGDAFGNHHRGNICIGCFRCQQYRPR